MIPTLSNPTCSIEPSSSAKVDFFFHLGTYPLLLFLLFDTSVSVVAAVKDDEDLNADDGGKVEKSDDGVKALTVMELVGLLMAINNNNDDKRKKLHERATIMVCTAMMDI